MPSRGARPEEGARLVPADNSPLLREDLSSKKYHQPQMRSGSPSQKIPPLSIQGPMTPTLGVIVYVHHEDLSVLLLKLKYVHLSPCTLLLSVLSQPLLLLSGTLTLLGGKGCPKANFIEALWTPPPPQAKAKDTGNSKSHHHQREGGWDLKVGLSSQVGIKPDTWAWVVVPPFWRSAS
ncbi:ASNSD1 upstream open reading frame protein isoform X1 [Talpa occidentalis]|uniref:ASNSD1 upstream open reading frame protein isoform X1 n=1 Tax=Talpa occidentalis TaxID=50954 RepID=UPI0023F7AE0B|nr:ASNSD1 upstream open reading frame protein isoform X1 [Talpa occidentalis]